MRRMHNVNGGESRLFSARREKIRIVGNSKSIVDFSIIGRSDQQITSHSEAIAARGDAFAAHARHVCAPAGQSGLQGGIFWAALGKRRIMYDLI